MIRVRRWASFFRRTIRRPAPPPIRLPEVDLYDSPGGVVVGVETWDLDPKNIEIRMSGRVLTLIGKKPADGEVGASTLGDFRRSVVLPAGINPGKAVAKYKGKRLVIRIPKEAAAAPEALDQAVKL